MKTARIFGRGSRALTGKALGSAKRLQETVLSTLLWMFIIFPCIGVAGDILPGVVDPALHLSLVLGAAIILGLMPGQGPCGCARVCQSQSWVLALHWDAK